jgi:hypothetical protein
VRKKNIKKNNKKHNIKTCQSKEDGVGKRSAGDKMYRGGQFERQIIMP